jgi:hypothetical protein
VDQKKPGSFPPGVLLELDQTIRISTLNANVQADSVLVLELVVVVGFGAPPAKTAVEVARPGPLPIFWSRWNHWTSAENVRFLTGVQRVTTPSCETLKFGSQV